MDQVTVRRILTYIIIVYIAIAALYAIYTPKWQSPDEPAHFNYIRTIAETGSLPILQSGDYDQAYLEKIKAAKFPASMSIDSIRYESYQPPLYYLAATPVYIVARLGGLAVQVIALRLFSVALGAILLIVAFTIVREIFTDDALIAFATVGLMASVPMHIAISASISNDIAGELILALILLLAVKRIKNSITDRKFLILGGILFGVALLTKLTAYIPGALVVMGAESAHVFSSKGSTEQRSNLRNRIFDFRLLLVVFIIAVLISLPMFVHNITLYGPGDPLGEVRHDSVVIGQPTTAEMIARYGITYIISDVFVVTFKSFWAQFGWMGVLVNDRIYVILLGMTTLAALGFALYTLKIFRRRELLSQVQWWCMGLLALLLVSSIADYIGYNFKFFQLQGRYLFPAMISIALFFTLGLQEMISHAHIRLIFILLYIGMQGLSVASLFLYIIPQLYIPN